MKSRRELLLERMRELVAEVGDGDGIPSRLDKRRERQDQKRQKKGRRKTRQLCGQVARILNIELPMSADPLLHGLWVEVVEPAPDTSRLRVTVRPAAVDDVSPDLRLARLEAARGRLRTAVAEAITRKKSPDLCFVVAVAAGLEEG